MTLSRRNKLAPYTRAGGAADLANSNGRIVRYLFSTPDVARDNHTIAHWRLDNFKRNPVFLWAHDSKSPPIGRVIELEDRAGRLSGSVQYAERDEYEFADTIFRLVKGGYIHAVSTSWDPIKWKFTTDRARPGGVDFELVDLLELSQVPVPALPNALATARAAGIDTGPLCQWAELQLDEKRSPVPRQQLEQIRKDSIMPVTRFHSREQREARAAQLRAELGMEQTGFRSFGAYLQAIANADSSVSDSRLVRAPAGANEGNPSAGGFLVPETFSDQLIGSIYESSVLANLCDRRQTSQPLAAHRIPGVDETSRADGSRWGGTASFWANEADSVSASAPRYRMIDMSAHKLTAVSIASSELLADAALLEGAVRRAFASELSFKLDTSILRGTGVGQPLGILNSPATIVVAKEVGQASASIVVENIDNMWSRLPAPSRRRAVWLINEDGEANLSKTAYVVGTAGVPLSLYPSSEGPPVLKGRPVIPIEQASAVGALGDITLVDLSQYLLLDGGLRFAISADARFDGDEITFRFTWRVDGRPAWASPITPFNGTATRSPFVALAAR